jgi:Lanthionine synthetase C-like protein
MTALFEPSRHEPLVIEAWDDAAARCCVETIVDDAVAAWRLPNYYPPHPDDDMLTGDSVGTSLYFGAVGVLWGITQLSAAGFVHDRREWLSPHLDTIVDATRGAAFGDGSLLLGRVSTLLLRFHVAPHAVSADLDAIHAALAAAAGGPVQELMWGIPGGALIAEALLRNTGEPRWRALLQRQLDAIWAARVELPDVGWLWNEELYGVRNAYLGLIHGFAGQVLPLLRAAALLSDRQRRELRSALPQILRRTAEHDGAMVNWPNVAGIGTSPCLVQMCHGAPGIVSALAEIPAALLPDVDDLLYGAGELIWRAGPLTKGSNLCHGTAGNGLALLKLFGRSGDELWLQRARSFAMHAIHRYHAARRRVGRDRYSLWTGDIGVALFLEQCISTVASLPGIDDL